MSIAFPYFISFLLGTLSLKLILKNNTPALNTGTFLIFSFILGLSFSVMLTFFSLIIFGQLLPVYVLSGHILLLTILIVLGRKDLLQKPKITRPAFAPLQSLIAPLFWIIGFIGLYLVAADHPFGEWDAWALWNLKTKFILYGGRNWTAIFDALHWHTHPDYPLFLPVLNSWLLSLTDKIFYPIPMYTSLIFSFGCGLLMYFGLRVFIHPRAAFAASLIILFNPYFAFLTTAQYADVILAFFLLAALISMILTIKTSQPEFGALSGIFLGLMTFTKNEGLVMTGLLGLLGVIYIAMNKTFSSIQKKKIIIALFLGAGAAGLPTLILKLFLAPANDDIVPGFALHNIIHFDPNQFVMILEGFKTELLDKRWCYVWIFLLIGWITGLPKIFQKEKSILTLFFLMYNIVIIMVYLYAQPEVDTAWWLKYSLRRILLTLLPALVFYIFYLHWHHPQKELTK